MELQDISIQNFGSIKKIDLPLNQPGLVLIKGINSDAPLADSNGSGKALAIDTPILTSTGWKTVAQLTVGDQVYTPAGTTTPVLAKSSVWIDRQSYTVVFDDGTSVVADENHLWQVSDHKSRARAGIELRAGVGFHQILDSSWYLSLKTTKQLSQGVLWRKKTKFQYAGHQWAIEQPAPLTHAAPAVVDIPGYALGAWLGDGSSSNAELTCFEPELIQHVLSSGQTIAPQTEHQKVSHRFRFENFQTKCRKLGVYNNKHIPDAVFFSSVEYRREVLAGILDTDGTVCKSGYVELTLTNLSLAEGVFKLICSLGYKCSFRESDAKLNGRVIGPRYRMGIFSNDTRLFKLTRKKNRLSTNARNKMQHNDRRTIIDVIPLPVCVPVQCIQVADPSGMFLCGTQLVPTHNSLLLEAICWALWGETVRELTGDEVVNRAFGKDCVVALTFKIDNKTYVVSRHRLDSTSKKPNDLTIKVDGKYIQSASSMAAMQELINQIVGFDFTTFCAMMPGTGVKVAKMSDKAVKDILESLLQTKQLAAAGELARAKVKSLETTIQQLQTKKTALTAEVTATKKHLEDLSNLIKDREARREDNIRRCEEVIAESNKFLEEQELALIPYAATNEHVNHSIAALESLTSLKKKYLTSQQQKAITLVSKRVDLEKEASTSDANLAHLKLHKESIASGICNVCKQPIEKAALFKSADVKLAAEVSNNEAIHAQLAVVREHVKAQEEEHKVNLQKLEDKLKTASETLMSAKKDQANLELIRERIRNIHKNLVNQTTALVEAKKDNTQYDQKISSLEDKLVACVLQIEEATKQEAALQEQVAVHMFWVNGFGPAGLRSYMLDFVTPILNERAAYYSNILTSGELKVSFSTKSTLKSGVEKDKFSIVSEYRHGSDSYKGASTGERARVDLIVSLALGDLAQFRTAKQLPWRFLDEPFESIDRAGTEAIVRLLNDQKARYKTVFVVTHRPDFSDLFTQTITVVKKDGITSLKESDESA